MRLMRMVILLLLVLLVLEVDSVSSVLVEAHYGFLSSDVALVYSSVGNHVFFSVVLVVSSVLFMSVNCLYNFELVVG